MVQLGSVLDVELAAVPVEGVFILVVHGVLQNLFM